VAGWRTVLICAKCFVVTLVAFTTTPNVTAQSSACDGSSLQSVLLDDAGVEVRLGDRITDVNKVEFTVCFLNSSSGAIQNHVDYNFVIKDTSGKEIFDAASAAGQQSILHTADGVVTIPYSLSDEQLQTIVVTVAGINFIPIRTEDAVFHRMPEFPIVAGQLLTLVAASPSNKYEAYVEWYHDDIGIPNSFSIRIVDPDEPTVALSVNSDFRIYDGDEYLLPTQIATDGDNIKVYNFAFPEPGSYTLIISVVEFNDSRERIEIPIQVTPEFPIPAAGSIALASSIAAAVIVIRPRLS